MKIFFVVPRLLDGGAEKIMLDIAGNIGSCSPGEHNVQVIQLLEASSEPVHFTKEFVLTRLRAKRLLFSLPRLHALVMKEKPDVVISSLKSVSAIVSIIKASPFTTFTHVCRVANTLSKEVECLSFLPKFFAKSWIYFTDLFVDRYICVSNGVQDDLQNSFCIHECRMTAIKNPVDVEKIYKLSRAAINNKPVFPRNSKIILSSGRLELQKNYIFLLNCFSKVRRVIDCELIILGEGSEFNALIWCAEMLGIRKHVHFAGRVDNPYPYYALSDLFVLSSIYEGMPNVLLEALALDVPVISTDCPNGPREIISSIGYGVLVHMNNEDEMVDAISNSLSRKEKSLSSEKVLELHNLNLITKLYLNVLKGG